MSRTSSREHLNLAASPVLTEDEHPIAIILVARRGWTARIAAIGIAAEYLRTVVVARHARGRRLGHPMIAALAAVYPGQKLDLSA
jgi:hypothetical protein